MTGCVDRALRGSLTTYSSLQLTVPSRAASVELGGARSSGRVACGTMTNSTTSTNMAKLTARHRRTDLWEREDAVLSPDIMQTAALEYDLAQVRETPSSKAQGVCG